MIDIHTSSTPAEDAAHAIETLLEGLQHTDTLVLFSGGSALSIVDCLHPEKLSSRHTLTVLDERYTFDETESNFHILSRTNFFKYAHEQGIESIDPRPQAQESLEDAAKRFDLALKHWHILHRDGVVIATVGIGPDGHTSGVLPNSRTQDEFSKLFLAEDACAVGYTTTPDIHPQPERITTTLTYIKRHVHHAIVFATGVQKKEALEKTLHGEIDYRRTPAQILREVQHTTLYTDLSFE